jgi:hypothetical protein
MWTGRDALRKLCEPQTGTQGKSLLDWQGWSGLSATTYLVAIDLGQA